MNHADGNVAHFLTFSGQHAPVFRFTLIVPFSRQPRDVTGSFFYGWSRLEYSFVYSALIKVGGESLDAKLARGTAVANAPVAVKIVERHSQQ